MAIKVFLLYNNHKGYTMIAVINLFRQLTYCKQHIIQNMA